MAEQYQPVSINTGSAQQAIQSTPNATPALDGLMQGIRDGFISADDIRRRIQSGPLEAATRAQDMADVTQVRPLQRQAVSAQLANVQAAEEFEAQTLPILNATKRATLEQAHQNALQFGLPDEILKVFYASVPGFLPFDPDKLHDKKTGQVNIPYASEMIQKAKQEAAKMQMNAKFTGPVKQSVTGPKGEMTETTTVMNTLTGQPVGVPITTDTKAADQTKIAQQQAQAAEGIRKEFHGNDTIQAFDKVDAAVNKIRIAAGNPDSTPFQDMSSIFGFMKVLDPGSTVREGEYATVQKSAGVPDRVRNLYNTVWAGQKLTPEQRKQLLASAEENYQGQLKNALPAIRQFADLEEKNGFAPGTVVPVEFREKLTVSPSGNLADLSIEQLKNVSIAGGAATPTPVISTQDEAAAAAEANALPPNVPFFKWNGKDYHNPNYRP